MRLLYVTKALPFGATEAFILPEVADHAAHGWEVWLAPLSRGELKHAEARDLLSRTLDQPLVSPVVLAGCLRGVLRAPGRAAGLLWRVLRARTPVLALRNLAVFPKAVWLSEEVRRHRFEHVHIHWAAAPATLGAVAAELAGVPFSLTAHRYDIAQNNLLAWKSAHACFVRVIDEPGREEFAARLPPGARPPQVLHMGVTVAPDPAPSRAGALSPCGWRRRRGSWPRRGTPTSCAPCAWPSTWASPSSSTCSATGRCGPNWRRWRSNWAWRRTSPGAGRPPTATCSGRCAAVATTRACCPASPPTTATRRACPSSSSSAWAPACRW